MPLLGFKKEFADAVERGEKLQTIRALRKDKRDPKPGQILYLYTGLRTKQCRKLGERTCTSSQPVTIANAGITLGPRWVLDLHTFAEADGFKNIEDLYAFFKKTHGLPFHGVLIKWGKLLDCI